MNRNHRQKAVIVIPPLRDFYITPHRISSLGVMTVEKVIRNAGIDACIVDGLNGGKNTETLKLPESLSYLKKHINAGETGRCSYFTRFRHFGSPFSTILEQVVHTGADICFIGCFAFCYGETVVELAEYIKSELPGITVVAGGAGVSVHPEYFLRSPSIDYTLSGEAETGLPPFIEYLRNGQHDPHAVAGLGWKNGNRRFIQPVDRVTSSDTMQMTIVKTFGSGNRTAFTTSLSRGCPASCRFCSNHLTHGKRFRHGTVQQFERLLDELPGIPAEHEVSMNFEDDNLLADYPFFRSVLERCRARFRNFSFTAENGMDYRMCTGEQAQELISAGCRQFNFTLGSLSDEILKKNDRAQELDRYEQLLEITGTVECPVITYVICGFPDDTKESVAAGLRYLARRKTVIGMSLFYPVPGLEGFDNRTLFDSIAPGCCTGAAAYAWGSLTTTSLITAFRLARFLNLYKSAAVTEEERELITRTLTVKRLHTVVRERKTRRIIQVPLQDEELAAMVLE